MMVSADLRSCFGYMLGHRSASGPPVPLTRSAADSEMAMESKSVSHCDLNCWIVPKTIAGARSYLLPMVSYYRAGGSKVINCSCPFARLVATKSVP